MPKWLASIIIGAFAITALAITQVMQPPAPSGAPATPRLASARFEYRNCDAARAAGDAPVRRGEPGYGPHLDRDDDGVGCEPYRDR